jgi:DNA processing protein
MRFFEARLDPGGFGGYLLRLAMVGSTGHNTAAEVSKTLGMISDSPFTPWPVNADDPLYPPSLLHLSKPPHRLWISGRLPPGDAKLVAMVGSRAVSRKGCLAVSDMAAELAAQAWSVVSGGALGMDAAAHRGALDAGGQTWAVLGCGIDVVYPDRHGELFQRIAASGGLLSEYAAGVPPRPGQFPARNRLVAALASALVVGESRRASGASITARLAKQLGRPIFAIPGSPGTDAMIASGVASSVASARDVLDRLAGKSGQVSPRSAEMEGLMMLFAQEPVGAAELATRAGVPLSRMLAMLCEAEMAGWVARAAGGKFEVNRGN